jgi:hypothetical protein
MTHDAEFNFYDDTTRSYNGPVAVLTGPFSSSASDFISRWIRSYHTVRFFGKTTASAFSAPTSGYNDTICFALYAFLNGCILQDSIPHYLTHEVQGVDEDVWLTPDDAAKGDDSVVKAALAWIRSIVVMVADGTAQTPVQFALDQSYPNPFNPTTTISYKIPKASWTTIEVFDLLGREVKLLVDEMQIAGSHNVKFNASGLASGVYFYSLRAGDFRATKKMLLVK